MYLSKSYNTVCLRPESYNTVSPRPESCDRQRALMSITPNLCWHKTQPKSIHSPDTSKEQASFNVIGTVIIHSNFIKKVILQIFHSLSPLFLPFDLKESF